MRVRKSNRRFTGRRGAETIRTAPASARVIHACRKRCAVWLADYEMMGSREFMAADSNNGLSGPRMKWISDHDLKCQTLALWSPLPIRARKTGRIHRVAA